MMTLSKQDVVLAVNCKYRQRIHQLDCVSLEKPRSKDDCTSDLEGEEGKQYEKCQ